MKKWHKPLAWASGAGFIVSLLWNLSLRAGLVESVGAEPRPAFFVLFMGVFVVFFPTVFYLQRFNKDMRSFRFRGWKYIFTGAPRWSVWVTGASFLYAFINFFSVMPWDQRHVSSEDVNFELVGSGHCMLFYAVAAVINWAAVRRSALGIDWVCEGGHALAPSDKFCSECGAPAKVSPRL